MTKARPRIKQKQKHRVREEPGKVREMTND